MSPSILRTSILALLVFGSGCGETSSQPLDAGQSDAGADGGEPDAADLDAGFVDVGDAEPFDTGVPPPDCGTLTTCGVVCTDLDSDPNNCGICARTCLVPRAQAGCDLGECTVAVCETGYFDIDGVVENGCETQDGCVPDLACTTSCGSEGLTACNQTVESCEPPVESCNMIDDDCNGQCDEGSLRGCRAPVHRAYGMGHFYTADLNEASTAPLSLEAQNYFYLYAGEVPETRPLFRCRKSDGKTLLTTDTACEMLGGVQATVGYISPMETCGAVPLHRAYHAGSNDHFYTLSATERDNAVMSLGYVAEGIAGYVWTTP